MRLLRFAPLVETARSLTRGAVRRCSGRFLHLSLLALVTLLGVLAQSATLSAVGRWKLEPQGCVWNETDTGPNQCTPDSGGTNGDGRWRLTSGMCMWEENSALADQCTPGEGVGRWKTYGGCFWEPGVIAQNQCEPTSGSSGGSNGTWQLLSGGTLGSGGYLESPSRRYRFTNTQNGALELSEHGYVIWSRGPFGTGSLSMQNTDGNLIFVVNGVHVWASNTPAGRMPPPIPLRIRLIPEERPVHLRKRRIS